MTDEPIPPTSPPKPEDDETRAVREFNESEKEKKIPKTPSSADNLKVHRTVPMDKTLAKLKAKRVPHRYPKKPKGEIKNGESNNNSGRSSDAGDGGKLAGNGRGAGGNIFPVDWFRKR